MHILLNINKSTIKNLTIGMLLISIIRNNFFVWIFLTTLNLLFSIMSPVY